MHTSIFSPDFPSRRKLAGFLAITVVGSIALWAVLIGIAAIAAKWVFQG